MTDNESTRALMATIDSLTVQRDAAEALARERENDVAFMAALLRTQAPHVAVAEVRRREKTRSERAEADRDAAERRESELGLQVVAQAARLRLADGLYQCLLGCHRCGCQHPACSWCRDDGDIRDALAAWDAVPGDQG